MKKPEKSVYERTFGSSVGGAEVEIQRETPILLITKDKDEQSVVVETTSEFERSKQLQPNYGDVKLQKLVENGIEPKHLNIQTDDRMGSDSEFERLAQHIENNREKMFEPKN